MRHAVRVMVDGTVLGLSFAMVAGSAACTEPSSRTCVCDAAPAVDTALVAVLSKYRAAHHQADLREQSGDVALAIEVMEKAMRTSGGFDVLLARAEVREVRADMLARLSELRSRQGDFEGAERDVRGGLELAPRDSYFEGHLHETRGINEERRAKALMDYGNVQASEVARRAALESFQRAMDVQDRVIRTELGWDGGYER